MAFVGNMAFVGIELWFIINESAFRCDIGYRGLFSCLVVYESGIGLLGNFKAVFLKVGLIILHAFRLILTRVPTFFSREIPKNFHIGHFSTNFSPNCTKFLQNVNLIFPRIYTFFYKSFHISPNSYNFCKLKEKIF